MIDYTWEPCAETYYESSRLPDRTWGLHFAALQVELCNEGWLALLLENPPDGADEWEVEDAFPFWLVDEKLFEDRFDAQEWAEDQDSQRFLAEEEVDESLVEQAYWDMMVEDNPF